MIIVIQNSGYYCPVNLPHKGYMNKRTWHEVQIHFEPEDKIKNEIETLNVLKFATGFDSLTISIENEYTGNLRKAWECDSLTKEEAQSIINVLQEFVNG